MSEVSTAIQSCYDHPDSSNKMALAECILYDKAAYRLEGGMQIAMTARGLSPSLSTSFLSDQAFTARMIIYAAPLFGSPQATDAYFGDAPNTVVNAVTR